MADKIFERGRLTDWIVATLFAPLPALDPVAVLVGDAVAPDAGGWSEGTPDQGVFVPYTVLVTGPGVAFDKQNIQASEAWDWKLRYQLRHAGGMRNQADWTADQARKVWDAQGETRLMLNDDPPHWKAFGFSVVTMGAVNRNDTVQPPYYEIVDDVQLSLSRCRT